MSTLPPISTLPTQPISKMSTLPPISTLPTLPPSTQSSLLALLFEPSPALTTLGLPLTSRTPPFPSYTALIHAIGDTLRALAASASSAASAGTTASLDDVLASHPRLGERHVDSALSRAEQAAMDAASRGGEAEGEAVELEGLNAAYEAAFPGLRYVVFVNGRSRKVIFEDMRARIARGDIGAERLEGIQAMCDIASDRALKLA